jgi:hypothetical protein
MEGLMSNEMTNTHEGHNVLVLSSGEKSYRFAVQLWTAVLDACVNSNCFDVLGIANTTVPIETFDALEIGDVFQDLGIDGKFRIAWVEINPEAYQTAFFIESVLSNRGFSGGRVFLDESEARKWLLGASEA